MCKAESAFLEAKMRTDKQLPENMSMGDYQEYVRLHYSEDEQQGRIVKLVEWLYDYCLRSEKSFATFDGVWNYLDVDEKHLPVFKRQLESLKINDQAIKVSYHSAGHEIVIEWSKDSAL
jgi:hypothetical protein